MGWFSASEGRLAGPGKFSNLAAHANFGAIGGMRIGQRRQPQTAPPAPIRVFCNAPPETSHEFSL
jgi:hypothetical protein